MRHPSTPGLVSVIMPAHNSAATIADSVASVVAQSYRDWELLIVDDASSDETLSVAKALAASEPRIKIISLASNVGVANARNAGLAQAEGQYVAFLDSDDLWLPRKFEAQIRFMQEAQTGFSCTAYRMFAADDSEGVLVSPPERVTYNDLLKGNVIGCLTVVIDRELVPPFIIPNIKHEDFACWLQILKNGIEARGLQQDLARYRKSAASVSGDKRRCAAWTWRILRHVEHLSLPRALWCFAHYSIKSASKHL